MFHSPKLDTFVDVCCLFAVVMTPFGLIIHPLVSIGLLQLALLGQIYTKMPRPPRS
jgi:hypothetical protein